MFRTIIDRDRRAFLGTSALALSSAVLGGSGSTEPRGSSAQSHPVKQPAVIGYPNEKGIAIERVTYGARNIGSPIVANLFKPAGFETGRSTRLSWSRIRLVA